MMAINGGCARNGQPGSGYEDKIMSDQIKEILRRVNHARKMFHNSEEWYSDVFDNGETLQDWIESAEKEAIETIQSLQKSLNQAEIERDEVRVHYLDLQGIMKGKICNMCNYLERSACYENTEKLEAEIQSLRAENELLREENKALTITLDIARRLAKHL